MLIAILHVTTKSWFFFRLYFIEGTTPIPGEHKLHRMERSRKGMAHFVKKGIWSLQEKEYNT